MKLGSMITTSDPKATVDPNDYVDAGDVESRRYNAWGDEDEDEKKKKKKVLRRYQIKC